MRLGIDVSDNQGVIDWLKVKGAGVTFAILRSVRGSLKPDYQFEDNYAGCCKTGIKIGVYKYSYATTVSKALEEAKAVLKLLNGRKLDYPVYFDMEDKCQRTLGQLSLTAIANAFMNTIRDGGYRAEIYCSLDWYCNILDTQGIKTDGYWVARYGQNNGKAEEKYKPNVGEAGWQFTSKGSIDGISGYVDMNYMYKEYQSGEGGSAETEEEKSSVIRLGSEGEAVFIAKCALFEKGFTCKEVFTEEMREVVVRFQKSVFPDSPKEWDGIIGEKTWAKLLDNGEAAADQQPEDKKLGDFLFIGDSFFNRLETYGYKEKYGFQSKATGGWTAWDIINHFVEIKSRFNPKAIVLYFGINDLGKELWNGTTSDYIHIVRNLQSMFPELEAMYLCKILPTSKNCIDGTNPYGWQFPNCHLENIQKYNQQMEEIAGLESCWHCIDVSAGLLDAEGYLDWNKTEEGVHINKDYYSQFFHNILKNL